MLLLTFDYLILPSQDDFFPTPYESRSGRRAGELSVLVQQGSTHDDQGGYGKWKDAGGLFVLVYPHGKSSEYLPASPMDGYDGPCKEFGYFLYFWHIPGPSPSDDASLFLSGHAPRIPRCSEHDDEYGPFSLGRVSSRVDRMDDCVDDASLLSEKHPQDAKDDLYFRDACRLSFRGH